MALRWLQPDALLWEGRLVRDVALAIAPDGTCEIAGLPPPDATLERLPGKLLLPGLVNAHSHAFQRLLRGRTQAARSRPAHASRSHAAPSGPTWPNRWTDNARPTWTHAIEPTAISVPARARDRCLLETALMPFSTYNRNHSRPLDSR